MNTQSVYLPRAQILVDGIGSGAGGSGHPEGAWPRWLDYFCVRANDSGFCLVPLQGVASSG
jgi:hypothetical protein